MRRLCVALLLLAPLGAEPALTVETNRPEHSTYAVGERVQATFSATGLKAEPGLALGLELVDEHDARVAQMNLAVTPDAAGAWRATVDLPAAKLGFYRVRARLSNGVTLARLGTRQAGYLTYAVVPDPAKRPLYPAEETYFGMQGGFSPKVNVLPYLGIRWVLGGYRWDQQEPKQSGEFAVARAAAKDKPAGKQDWSWAYLPAAGPGTPWRVYPLPCLYNAPKWAALPETASYSTAALSPAGEAGWRDYCLAVGKALQEDLPDLPVHYCQITWEPVYPWGYKGTDEQLIRIHQIAFEALHQADPKVKVLGPTGAGISRSDVEWNANLLRKGLGRYLDGLAIHPYHAFPPERLGYLDRVRELKEAVRQYAGKELPIYGTEQGHPTGEDPANELDQARGLLRENLILMGEGLRCNFAFYIVDYPTEPGYGYYYCLTPKVGWGGDRSGPKPAAPVYAAASYLLEGHRSTGAIEWLGETALGYCFERGDDRVLALWDYGDRPREVTVPVGVPQVEVFDWMGNARTVPAAGGQLKLTLGPEPVYVRGVSPALWGSRAKVPLRLAASRATVFPGGELVVRAELSGPGRAFDGTLTVEPDERLGTAKVTRPIKLTADGRAKLEVPLTIPADAPLATLPVRVTLADGSGAVAAAGMMLTVAPPVATTAVEAAALPDGRKTIDVTLREAAGRPLRGQVEVRLDGVPESRQRVPLSLAAGGTATVRAVYDDLDADPARAWPTRVTVLPEGGGRYESVQPVDFLSARRLTPTIDGKLDDWADVPAATLAGRGAVVRAPQFYRGKLSARLRYAWDERALYLAAEVTDPWPVQQQTGFNTWKGDCLQLAFDLDHGKADATTGNLLADAGARHRVTELDLALTSAGPEAYRTITFDAAKLPVAALDAKALPLAVVKTADGYRYEAALPWSTLGSAGPPGPRVGLALTVNSLEDPAQADPVALGLFGGIAGMKDPSRFGVLRLEGAVRP